MDTFTLSTLYNDSKEQSMILTRDQIIDFINNLYRVDSKLFDDITREITNGIMKVLKQMNEGIQ